MNCALRRRIMHAAHATADALTKSCVRDLHLEFHRSLDPSRVPGDMARRVPRHATFLATIDTVFASPADVTQSGLLALHGAECLRRHERLVAFLVRHLAIRWDEQTAVEHAAREGARKRLVVIEGSPPANIVSGFQNALREAARPVSERTVKSYLGAAAGLLAIARVDTLSDLTQRHVNGWIMHRRGRANDLRRFLRWVTSAGGPDLAVSSRPRQEARTRERAILHTAKDLTTRLRNCRNPHAGRALLARSIAVVHGVRLEDVLRIGAADVRREYGLVTLALTKASITLDEELSSGFERFVRVDGAPPFVGRARLNPLSVSGTAYHSTKNVEQPYESRRQKRIRTTETLSPET